MKKVYIVFALLLSMLLAEGQTWTGTSSTSWNVAANWNPAAVPAASGNVIIPASVASGNWPSLVANVAINSINMQSGSRLNFNGFTLTLSNAATTYNYFIGATLNNTNGATDIVINIYTGNAGYTSYFRSNVVNDHITFNLTGSSNSPFLEGDVAPANQFNGNATYNINDILQVYIAYGSLSQYSGNLTINRTAAGTSSLFAAGANIGGNFSFTNNAGGAIGIGNTITRTNINGTVNIACNYPAPATFDMYNITNQTTGGVVNVQNSQGMFLQKDTLKLASLNVTGYRSGGYGYFWNNSITGNVNIADDASYTGGYATYIRNNVITGNAVFTNNGSNAMLDADGIANTNNYNGNVTFNGAGTGTIYIGHGSGINCTGNITINRTVAGTTYAFNSGGNITGNFNYNNNVGGDTYFGNIAAKTSIGGTLNFTANFAIVSAFLLHRIINQTSGGIVNVQNSRAFDVRKDTLKLSQFNITNYTGGAYGYLYNNNITGNITISSHSSYTGNYSTYIHNNTITGTSTFTNDGTNTFNEAEAAGTANHYIGNTIFNATGSGTFVVSHQDVSIFDGNISFNRSAAGTSYLFYNGGIVNGNFSYSNLTAGDTYLGNAAFKTAISGTVNITANFSTPNNFEMYRLVNQTSGGSINVSNSRGFTIQADTLRLAALNITGYRGNQYAYFSNNAITGNVALADDATYTGGFSTYIRRNTITGNSSFSVNGTNIFYDADAATYGNTYNGNLTYTLNGIGGAYIAHAAPMQCSGNVTVTRSTAGTTYLFLAGSTLAGNLSYTNNTSGFTSFGNVNIKTSIGGTINIAANYSSLGNFEMFRLINQTAGGSVNVQNSGPLNLQKDTLLVNTLSLTGYGGNGNAFFYNNSITGNLVTSDAATYSNGYASYFRSNFVSGNASITRNGTNTFNEADGGPENTKYGGNVTYANNAGGTFNIGLGDTVEIGQDLILNSSAGIALGSIKFTGATPGVLDQLGSQQPINLPTLIMDKTGAGSLTLSDSLTIGTTASFVNGHLYTSANKNLIFPDNISYTGASAASHVIGPVTKIGDDAFIFPVGSPTTLNTVAISTPVGATSKFRAEYKNQNPGSNGFNTSLKAGSFGAAGISKAGYWDVQRLAGTTNVTLTEGFVTNPYEQYPVLANLKAAHWNGAQWDDHGNGGTTGTAANGTVVNSVPITSFSPFALAGITGTYFYKYSNPGAGPDGTALKFSGTGGYPAYSTKQLPAGVYSLDSIYLIPNASAASFKLRDVYGVEKDDTTVTAPTAPVSYITANGNGTKNFTGWRHFVYMTNGSNNIMGAIRDNGLTLGNTVMTTYFSTPNVATSPNGNIYLKRSFKITSEFAPVGTRRVRFYISKTEFTNLQSADPTAFPAGINSLTITKYTGPQEDSLFNPIPGGNAVIIPNSAITIADLGTMYSLDIDVTGFSGFYIGGNNSKLNVCSGTTISLPSNISGSTYQWQADNGSGYANITNTGAYTGTSTATLTITNAPANLYGYKYRCVVNGGTFSQEYQLKFSTSWEGGVSNAWENTANWSCGQLPDASTDVVINAGKSNYPQLGANTTVRTLKISTGATITVKTGFTLNILQ